jgi:hypothetical protein
MKEILLIGNGPSCLDNEYGELIDSHDIVVRFNNFETESFEKFVGTKTNYWVKTIMSNKHDNAKFDKKFFVYPRVVSPGSVKINSLADEGYTIVPVDFYDEINKLINKPNIWATTGLVMIYYFLTMGYDVKIHGFDFFKNGVHYYDDGSKMRGHKPDIEKLFVDKLIKMGRVIILK